jgi:hypothetical protein
MARPLDLETLLRLLALFTDKVQARVNGDPVNVAEFHAEGRAILRDFGDAWVRAHDHKNRLK